jgi:hypothetical protein
MHPKIFLPKKQEVDTQYHEGQYHEGTRRKKEYPNLPNEKGSGNLCARRSWNKLPGTFFWLQNSPSRFGEFVVYHSMIIVCGRGNLAPTLTKKK